MRKRALPLDQQLCFALYSANNAMGRWYRPMLKELGITYAQYLVLLALWENDNQTVGVLGNMLYLESNTLTPLLKRLEAAGFVTRKRRPEDERNVIVSLTETGKRLEAGAYDIALCAAKALDEGDEEIASLREQIAVLADRLRTSAK